MSVRKFRSIEEMKRLSWYEPGDPALPVVIEGIWNFGERTAGLRFPPGVYRHRDIEGLNTLTDHWALDNFKAFQERQTQSGKRSPKDLRK